MAGQAVTDQQTELHVKFGDPLDSDWGDNIQNIFKINLNGVFRARKWPSKEHTFGGKKTDVLICLSRFPRCLPPVRCFPAAWSQVTNGNSEMEWDGASCLAC